MDAERNKVKQKMNTSLNGSFLLQATPRKSKPVARYAVICKTFCPCLCCKEDTDPANLLISLRFAPDWVLRRDKMKDIVDPLCAIQMLVNALALVP